MAVRVEIGVDSVDGVTVARRAGADRVELCAAQSEGGLTPSAGLIELAVAAAGAMEVHVLVRPRPGDFRYLKEEIRVARHDIAVARRAGAAGVVVGALDDAGELDLAACAGFVAAAEGLTVTLHRAIDVSADSHRTLDRALELGFARVLTSGRRRHAFDGAALIRELVARAAGAIDVMAGGGVRAGNALRLLASTGVADLHAAVRAPVGVVGSAEVSFAAAGVPAGFDRFATDPDGVAALCAVARRWGSGSRSSATGPTVGA